MSQLRWRTGSLRISPTGPRRLLRVAVRAQSGTNTTSVSFKIHRHVDYGQSLLVIGNIAELGSWDAKHAAELLWGEGDVWGTTLELPQGSAIEYKYIIKRKEALEWCPGDNKAFALPAASAIQVTDTWESSKSNVVILKSLETAPQARSEAMQIAEAPATFVPEPHVATPAPVASASSVHPPPDTIIPPPEAELYSAVSTVENIHVAELEGITPSIYSTAPKPDMVADQRQEPPVLLANNIVQAVPMGAIAVSQDPITQYEEADKYQVVEVGRADKTVAATATEARPAAKRSTDSMTVAELRSELKRRGMSSLGNRRELVTRLQAVGALD